MLGWLKTHWNKIHYESCHPFFFQLKRDGKEFKIFFQWRRPNVTEKCIKNATKLQKGERGSTVKLKLFYLITL